MHCKSATETNVKIYKTRHNVHTVIQKTLENALKSTISKCIKNVQSAFIP